MHWRLNRFDPFTTRIAELRPGADPIQGFCDYLNFRYALPPNGDGTWTVRSRSRSGLPRECRDSIRALHPHNWTRPGSTAVDRERDAGDP